MYVCYSTYPYGQPTVTPVATADIAPSYVSTGAPTIQPAITEPILVPVTATPQGIQAALQSLPIAVCRKVFTFYFYHHVQSQFSTYSRWAIFFSVKKILIFFLFLDENILWVLIRRAWPLWGAIYVYSQHAFLWRNKRNIGEISLIWSYDSS